MKKSKRSVQSRNNIQSPFLSISVVDFRRTNWYIQLTLWKQLKDLDFAYDLVSFNGLKCKKEHQSWKNYQSLFLALTSFSK